MTDPAQSGDQGAESAIAALEHMASVDFAHAAALARAGTTFGPLNTVAAVAAVVGDVFPPAKIATDLIELLVVVIKLKEAGYWAPAADAADLNRKNNPAAAE